MPYLANPELVLIHWLKGVNGVPVNQIGTTLPDVSNTDFQDNGFIQVSSIGGIPDQDTFMQNTTMQIDVWAFTVNSNKAPWGKAFNLAMLIKNGLQDAARLVETPDAFHNAYVHEVRVLIDPRRILGDEANFARYSFDVALHWTHRELV